MKLLINIIPLLITLLLVGCSNDDYSSIEDSGETYFNPPTWIQGEWGGKNSSDIEIIFTKNNVDDKELPYDWNSKLRAKNLLNPTKLSYVEEEIDENQYNFKIYEPFGDNGYSTSNYQFRRIDKNTIAVYFSPTSQSLLFRK